MYFLDFVSNGLPVAADAGGDADFQAAALPCGNGCRLNVDSRFPACDGNHDGGAALEQHRGGDGHVDQFGQQAAVLFAHQARTDSGK